MKPIPGRHRLASETVRTGPRASVLGHPLDLIDLETSARHLTGRARTGHVTTVITLNPELVVRARSDAALQHAIHAADLVVPDGVGIVWAARRSGISVPGRVPGVELTQRILELAEREVPTFLLGARPGVAAKAADVARERFGTQVVGVQDGYFDPSRDEEIAARIAASGAQLLVVGLGERQERFVEAQRANLGPVVALSVGGTLDVLAGAAKRTPAWTHRMGLEWAWRIGFDPARWHRAPRLAQFAWQVLTAPR